MMPCRTASGAVLEKTFDLRIGNRAWFLFANALTPLADDDALPKSKWSHAEEHLRLADRKSSIRNRGLVLVCNALTPLADDDALPNSKWSHAEEHL